ncbi:MAG: thioredoxin family protein [Methylobacter sp.]|nr:thioredoxin family protein [Methylobacter sp.]
MNTAIFYHAGCPVCLGVEHMVTEAIDRSKYQVDTVHLGERTDRIKEAEAAGVKSVPALVLDGQVFHINFGASIEALKH